jgi:hypothetical protein
VLARHQRAECVRPGGHRELNDEFRIEGKRIGEKPETTAPRRGDADHINEHAEVRRMPDGAACRLGDYWRFRINAARRLVWQKDIATVPPRVPRRGWLHWARPWPVVDAIFVVQQLHGGRRAPIGGHSCASWWRHKDSGEPHQADRVRSHPLRPVPEELAVIHVALRSNRGAWISGATARVSSGEGGAEPPHFVRHSTAMTEHENTGRGKLRGDHLREINVAVATVKR